MKTAVSLALAHREPGASGLFPTMIEILNDVLVDSREQRPWFTDGATVPGFTFTARRATLPTADYSLAGLEDRILIERKSLGDLVGCVGHGRERFERELARMAEETAEAWLFIEASRHEIELKQYRGRIMPSQVIGSLQAWSCDHGVKVWLAGSAEVAARDALRLLKRIENRVEADPAVT